MSIRVQVSAKGSKGLQASITRRANFLGSESMKRILQEEGKRLVQQIQNDVAGYNPGPMKDLTPNYKKRKQSEVGFAYPILYKYGKLVGSMRARVRRPGSQRGWGIGFIFVGQHHAGMSNAELARIHRDGEGRNPKRDFVRIPKGWNLSLLNRIRRALRRR